MSFNADHTLNLDPDTAAVLATRPGVVSAVLAWLWMWLAGGRGAADPVFDGAAVDRHYHAVWNYTYNRNQRRMAQSRTIKPFRYPGEFDRVLSRGLSPTQRLERLTRLSINGRIRVYHFGCRGSRLLPLMRPAICVQILRCEPVHVEAQLCAGLWCVHAWPGWGVYPQMFMARATCFWSLIISDMQAQT